MNREKEIELKNTESTATSFDALDRALLMLLQEEIPLIPHPYRMLAEQFQLDEEAVIDRLYTLKERNVLRRVGAILRPQKAGYLANALTAWNADPKENETREQALERVGKALAAQPCVSHCYARKTPPGWDWPVFAMVHAATPDELESCIKQLMQAVCSTDVRILKTVREWKKTSMKYF